MSFNQLGTVGLGQHFQAGTLSANRVRVNTVSTDTIVTSESMDSTSILLSEASSRIAPGAGKGRLWVRDDSPNVLVFTNDEGTDMVFGVGDLAAVLNSGNDANDQAIDNVSGVNFSAGVQLDGSAGTSTSVAIGSTAAANGAGDVAIGQGATTSADHSNSIAIGYNATTSDSECVAIAGTAAGHGAVSVMGYASGARGIAIRATSKGNDAIAIGQLSYTSGADSISIGVNADANSSVGAVTIGRDSNVTGDDAIAIGSQASVTGDHGVAIGMLAEAGANELAINVSGAAATGTSGSLKTTLTAVDGGSLTGGGITPPATISRYLTVTIGATVYKIPLYT